MSIYQLLVINRAGSLIYDWDGSEENPGVEKTFSYPLDIVLDVVDQKVTVVFGERDGVFLRYTVSAINGVAVQGGTEVVLEGRDWGVMDFLADEANFPVNVRFAPPSISTNEKIILSSTFHSLFTIAAQLSPVPRSSGIQVLTTAQFKLHCVQSTSGVKLVAIGTAGLGGVEGLLHKMYELYADYALKNPFYSMDMPIRCQRFDDAIKGLVEKHHRHNLLTV